MVDKVGQEVAHSEDQERGQEAAEGVGAPPYISFLQLLNLFDWLKGEGVPHRFDRTFWARRYSGSMGPQLLSALRFLGLLRGNEPTPALESLVLASAQERQQLLTNLLKDAYSAVDFEKLSKATPGMVGEWLGNYPGEGDTKRKVESFFINALKYADFPLSPSLRRMARNRPNATAKPARKPTSDIGKQVPPGVKPPVASPSPNDQPQPANIRAVRLTSGGEIALSLNVDLFSLSEDDRAFVMRLVDEVRKYEEMSIKPG